jgi:hypothetical protein
LKKKNAPCFLWQNNVLVVPVCTYREKDGKPFIKEKSYIKYRNALAMSLIDIFNGLRKGKLVKQLNFDNRFVQDMQRGAEESIFLPEKLKTFFEYFL